MSLAWNDLRTKFVPTGKDGQRLPLNGTTFPQLEIS